jgi:type I restriction enzyme S subunit
MKKWLLKKLGEVADFTNGGAWTPDEYVESGIPVVRVSDIQNETINLQQCKYLLPESISKYKKHTLFQGDLVIATVGSHPTQPGSVVGRPGIVPQYVQGALLNQNAVRIAPDNNYLDKKYLAYLGKSQFFRNYIIRHARGSANQVRMSIGLLKEMEVLLPPLPIQRKIAAILSAYDDLIENNTRRIEILEEMARSIYCEWFVKFRFPGHEQVQRVDSELGLIPEGWEVVKIGDVAEVGRGSSPRPIADQKYFEGGTIPWIKIADATKSGKYLYETKQKVNEYGASFSRLLPKGSLIIAASGTLGYTQLLGVDGCIHDGWLYLINFKGIEKEYLYYLFREQQQFFYNAAYGAAIQNVNTMILREMKIILPPSQLQKYFKDLISNSDNLLDNLGRKNLNLRKTRDLLLPRLISGEIDVENLDINTGPIAA